MNTEPEFPCTCTITDAGDCERDLACPVHGDAAEDARVERARRRCCGYTKNGQKEWQMSSRIPKGQLRHHISARKIAAQTNSRTTLPYEMNRLPS